MNLNELRKKLKLTLQPAFSLVFFKGLRAKVALLSLFSSLTISSPGFSMVPLKKAQKIISEIDYLPFSVKRDGCYARSYYMGMELAARGIAASNFYVFGALNPEASIFWRYHVAPVVRVTQGSKAQYVVFDPSLNPRAMTTDYWTLKSGGKPDSQVANYISPASHYAIENVQKNSSQNLKGYSLQKPLLKLEDQPNFMMVDIAKSCRAAWNHIGEEKISTKDMLLKRRKLVKRTDELIEMLSDMEKLSETAKLVNCSAARYIN